MVQPGIVGVHYVPENGLIMEIGKDAQNKIKENVRVGWIMKYLDNEIFTDELFNEKRKDSKPYKITFVKSVIF